MATIETNNTEHAHAEFLWKSADALPGMAAFVEAFAPDRTMLVDAPERIERLAAFIVEHWEKRRAAMVGKAMIVTMSRDIAARLDAAIRVLRPSWHDADDERGAMKVVFTDTSGELGYFEYGLFSSGPLLSDSMTAADSRPPKNA